LPLNDKVRYPNAVYVATWMTFALTNW